MLRIISCQQATLFIEQQADTPLASTDHNSLWLHLRYCPLCSRYAQQTIFLSQLARSAAQNHAAQPGLPDEARARLQRLLEERQKS